MTPIHDLPDDARVWVFGAASLDPARAAAVVRAANEFIATWSAHGVPLRGAADLVGRTLLVIALDQNAEASGCSIDKLYRFVRQIGMLDSDRVFYRDRDGIRSSTRAEFRKLAEAGRIGDDTIVIDTTVERLGDIRDRGWEKPLAESWHARLIAAPLTTGSGR